MNAALLVFGLVLLCCGFMEGTRGDQLDAGSVWSECRDRYLWIRVASTQTPLFEAVDGDEVHSIDEQLASRCGYTISTLKTDRFTTFRASYYSCFTDNQNDEAFVFKFNVMVSDRGGRWISRSVSAVCSGLAWTHREITCEENYMEVNVNRESSCGGQRGESKQAWQEVLSQVQRKATWTWQLMFLQSNGGASSMSFPEAQRWGYSLMASTNRVVFRSPYRQPHAEVTAVDGVPVEAVQVSLFFKQKLLVVMIDMSMACPLNSGSFDGIRLRWDVPQVLPSLIGEGAGFESQNFSLGLEGVLLDKPSVISRGLSMVQQGGLVKIGVPFGTEGGYRKGLVVENSYKEVYMVLVLYEHVFSLMYEDGSSINTKHRMLKVLETPPICHPPFTINKTISEHQVFKVYLGNIPTNVVLEDVKINGKLLLISGKPQPSLSVSPFIHVNGSRAYELKLPFDDAAVRRTNVGGGVVQFSIDMEFTLLLMPQRESYHHHTRITAEVLNVFPPEITAQCLEGGLAFSVVRPAQSLWEVGIDQEALTPQLVAQRGYRLHNDSQRTTLEIPIFSVGYTYEEINLSNFYATFKLVLRDSKTLEVQASTSKRCLFRTQDMIVCSSDGTMTVVATPTSTWPLVQPERTSLLDRNCRPRYTDGTRVLFEFKLNSCGTRAMVGEWYVVYENEILHDRQLIADGPNLISREPQFKVTVRCFYPLTEVNRVSVDRIADTPTPGFGSFKVFESNGDSEKKPCPESTSTVPAQRHSSTAAVGALPPSPFELQPNQGPSHFSVPGDALQSSVLPNRAGSPDTQTHQVPQLNTLPDGRIQWLRLKGLQQNLHGQSEATSEPDRNLKPFERIPEAPVSEPLESRRQIMNSVAEGDWASGQEQDLKRILSLGTLDLKRPHETKPGLSLHGSSVGMEMPNVVKPVYQPPGAYKPPQTTQVKQFLQPQDHVRNELLQPSKYQTHVPAESIYTTFKNPSPAWPELLQESFSNRLTTAAGQERQNLERTIPVERRNVQSRVQNIRVKPPSKFASSSHRLNQKPVVQPAYSLSSDSPNLQETPEHQGSSSQQEKPGAGQQGLHGVQINITKPNWAGHQQKLDPALIETEGIRPELVSHLRDALHGPGMSQRPTVRPTGLRLQIQNQPKLLQIQDSMTKEIPSRLFYQSSVPQTNTSPVAFNVQTPTGQVGSSQVQMVREGSDSDLTGQGGLGCSGETSQHGASVHQGILRGKQNS